ncbi:MAG: sugar-binding protein, partial [Symploca sp. SIO2B6]|nr:sugar-binding protein [Symploca sp. SIO2B6]
MTYSSNHEQQIQAQNDESLRILARALTLSQGKFSLILANCQYRHVRDRIVTRLQDQCAFDIERFTLPQSAETLYSPIAQCPMVQNLGKDLDQNPPKALMVFGLEQVEKLTAVLKATNLVREEFRQNLPFPIVLWVNRQVKTALIRSAPDFESWSTTVEFLSHSEDLRSVLVQESDRIFDTLLDVGSGLFLDNRTLGIQPGSPLLVELETARSTLQKRGTQLDAALAGSLEFICGRAAVADEERSRQHYERSIELLKTSLKPNDASNALERLGCVQHHLGVWWHTYSVDHRAEHDEACKRARDCFREAIATFKTAQRLDLVARFTEKLGEVLQRLEDWDGLKQLVEERLELHPAYPDLFREARTYGFRAELALAKGAISSGNNVHLDSTTNLTQTATGKLTQAKEWATQALQLLEQACESETIPTAFDREIFIDWHNSFLRGWYRFALGRAHRALGETAEAIQALEQAKAETNEAYDPPLCISILQELRELYFDQGQYLEAFETRQAYRSIEQQYGYRAFVGAGRLRAKKAIANPSLAHVEAIGQVSTEISASGRQQDVERLIGRLQRSDQ